MTHLVGVDVGAVGLHARVVCIEGRLGDVEVGEDGPAAIARLDDVSNPAVLAGLGKAENLTNPVSQHARVKELG